MNHFACRLLAATALIAPAGGAMATTVTGWNLENVVVEAGPLTDGVTYSSPVYDRDVTGGTTGAATNGAVTYSPPEAGGPGIKIVTNGPDLKPSIDIPNCIMASSSSSCEGDFQSGKRFKLRMDAAAPIDLVFDTGAGSALDGTVTEQPYQIFAKLKNNTGSSLSGFTAELGFGVGADFIAATLLDQITLAPLVGGDPATQFPFGLFGDASTSSNHDLDGFFAPATAGFNADFAGTTIASTAMYGPYEALFGDWMTLADAPEGYFWDNDGDAETDAILMAWLRPDGEWEQRRAEDLGEATPTTPFTVAEADLVSAGYLAGPIEDVVNLNLNAYVAFGASYDDGRAFTIRVTGIAADVPLPGGIALMAGALGLLGGLARRRRKG